MLRHPEGSDTKDDKNTDNQNEATIECLYVHCACLQTADSESWHC